MKGDDWYPGIFTELRDNKSSNKARPVKPEVMESRGNVTSMKIARWSATAYDCINCEVSLEEGDTRKVPFGPVVTTPITTTEAMVHNTNREIKATRTRL